MAAVPEEMGIKRFETLVGNGWLHNKANREGIYIFQGNLRITEDLEFRLDGKLDSHAKEWEITIRNFGGKWEEVTTFKLPALGTNQYVEGSFKLPLTALGLKPTEEDTPEGKLLREHRIYKVRAFKYVKKDEDGKDMTPSLRLRLPEIVSNKTVIDIPM